MLVGETVTGYYAQLMVNPKTVAKIMLDYDYPFWTILDEEAPQGMWDQLAKVFGLDAVSEVKQHFKKQGASPREARILPRLHSGGLWYVSGGISQVKRKWPMSFNPQTISYLFSFFIMQII